MLVLVMQVVVQRRAVQTLPQVSTHSLSLSHFAHSTNSRSFFSGETATCLYNFPHENQLLPRVLPGTMLSLDEQCKRDRGTNACFKVLQHPFLVSSLLSSNFPRFAAQLI